MWVAFPSNGSVVPGAEWYDQLWSKNDFGGYRHVDDMIALSPCKQHDKIFIQIGAHLGIFPLVAAYRGCQGVAVEPMPAASNFSRISALLNNWGPDKFLAINAVGSRTNGGFMWFDPRTISISKNDTDLTGKLRIPVTTLDAVNEKYGNIQGRDQSRISFVIIDVEGHEQDVLLGAEKLIQQQSVIVFEIEVWTNQPTTGPVTSFPGLELLVSNGYRLYTLTRNSEMAFNSCDELTNRLAELPKIFNQSCQQPAMPKGYCLGEVFAIRSGAPPLRQWLSSCPR